MTMKERKTKVSTQTIPHVELGAGLLAFSRPWPEKDSYVPTDTEAHTHLENAYYVHGIRFFDTSGSSYDSVAPDGSYRSSEERLGRFLRTLSPDQRKKITVSTKAGWHYDPKTDDYYVDHRFIPLVKSINQSIRRLGTKPDILFIQKLSTDTLQKRRRKLAVRSAMLYGRLRGIKHIGGAHATGDLEAARRIAADPHFSHQQLSFNQALIAEDGQYKEILQLSQDNGKCVVINRAFNMGDLPATSSDTEEPTTAAFSTIIDHASHNSPVVVLTGTVRHLDQNVAAFHRAKQKAFSLRRR